MASPDLIDELLDDWEDQLEQNPQLSLEEFLTGRSGDLPTEVLREFQFRAKRLASFNEQLLAIGDFSTAEVDNPKRLPATLDLKGLRPGLEPIAGYRLVAKLGEGGFGEVWKAQGPGGVHVALKIVPLNQRVGQIEQQSLEIIRDIRHPHLLAVNGIWRVGDLLVVGSELADRTLLDRLQEALREGHTGIPFEELARYMQEAAEAIDYLNEPPTPGRPRIQHLDIKPQNLLLLGNGVKVADFGLAQTLQFAVGPNAGSMTLSYAAPECIDGATSMRSDQYSLAVTFCQLRGGRLPFEGNRVELIEAHRKTPPDLSMLPEMERPAVAKALAKLPKDRWPSCSDFVRAIHKGTSAEARTWNFRLSAYWKAWQSSSRRTKHVAGGVVAFLLVSILVALSRPSGTNSEGHDSDASPQVTLAVLDFENHSNNATFDGYRLGFRDMLVTDLSQVSSIKVLERARLSALLQEHELAKTPFVDQRVAVRLGKGLSAHALLSGSYVISGADIRIDVRMISVETGQVLLAEAVDGKTSEMLKVQKSLTQRVLAGLNVTPSATEQQVLDSPQTQNFDAFRLYSEARLAQLKGQREEAKRRLQEALKKDSSFGLASQELNDLEIEAALTLTEKQERRAAEAGTAGKRLQEHWNTHRQIVAMDKRDPQFFASLILLSAHAGLQGDNKAERILLIAYWYRFRESVPPEQAVDIGKQINKLLVAEGKFFQEVVDSGDYAMKISIPRLPQPDGTSPTPAAPGAELDGNLKPELRNIYHWPRYSAMFPFDDGLRYAFDLSLRSARGALPVKIDSNWFEQRLPQFPHDYLQMVLDDSKSLKLDVIRYYSRLADKPQSLEDNVARLQESLRFQ